MRAILRSMGGPDAAMVTVLIAGTKGKGSTAAFLASILHAAGVRAGLFTSPHLQTFRERIRIDGAMLSGAAFDRAIADLGPVVARFRRDHPDAGDPTTYELTLALALRAFSARRCAVAIIEVGLGGLLDASNALDPAISVITPISHDHTAILGRSLARIAGEKAGISRPGRPLLVAVQRPTALAAIRHVARGAEVRIVKPLGGRATLSLAGDHQRQNAALAVAVARTLADAGLAAVPPAADAMGLRRAVWPARFERVGRRPTVIIDGAHNDGSAAALARTLRDERGGRRCVLVIGMNTDKDARAILRLLAPLASAIVTTRSSGPRAADPVALARRAARVTGRPIETAADIRSALLVARASAGRDGVVCVTGSLALAGDTRSALGLTPRERWW